MKGIKGTLHEFREVESEVKPWVSQFLSEHGRKPTLSDVQATNIDWLIQKYKKYNLMKQQLLLQIPGIREQQSSDKSQMMSKAKMSKAKGGGKGKRELELSAFFTAIASASSEKSPNPSSNVNAKATNATTGAAAAPARKGKVASGGGNVAGAGGAGPQQPAESIEERIAKLESRAAQGLPSASLERVKAALKYHKRNVDS